MKLSSMFGWNWNPLISVPIAGYWPGAVLPAFRDPLFVPADARLRFGVCMGVGSLDWCPGLCIGYGALDGVWTFEVDAVQAALSSWDYHDCFCGAGPVVVPIWVWAGGFVIVAGEPVALTEQSERVPA